MDNEQPHQELVKCVVVGDTAVGKTRLICARACNQQMSLSQLLTTHVPTVWAIDQYRIYKEVLERSWHIVDNVNVSLRLWDTFGDHEKDRRFAYGRSDVVLLCFSIGNRISLRNCRLMWYKEIRKFCPNTPVLLVGCKNDLRFIYRDKSYLKYHKERSPFIRLTKKSDLVMPEEARNLANELGLYYYETSVLTNYGIEDVFENAIRVALIARRQQRFWMTNLKKVKWPELQAPFMPPKPKLPEIQIEESCYDSHFETLLTSRFFADLIINIGNNSLEVHRFMLASASKVFKRLLIMNFSNSDVLTRSSSESSVVSSLDDNSLCGEFESEENFFFRKPNKPSIKMWDQIKRHASYQMLTIIEKEKKHLINREFNNHPIFKSIQVTNNFDSTYLIHTTNTIIVTLSSVINSFAFQQCVQFAYTGCVDFSTCDYNILLETAEIFEFHILIQFLKSLNPNNCDGTSLVVDDSIRIVQKQQLFNLLEQNLFTDIVFKLDDNVYPVHKAILVSRCEMMSAMFQGNFKESQSKVILFPGIKEHAFHKLMNFFYTDDVPKIATSHCLHIIELANRLCLPRFLNLIELRLVENFEKMIQHEHNLLDVLQTCLQILEPVKFHNADQLSDWCLNFLCINYNTVCKNLMKNFRQLNEDNQKFIIENRWPPIWYLKDYDLYQRCMLETIRERKRLMKDKTKSGCLCFVRSKVHKTSTFDLNSVTDFYIVNFTHNVK